MLNLTRALVTGLYNIYIVIISYYTHNTYINVYTHSTHTHTSISVFIYT